METIRSDKGATRLRVWIGFYNIVRIASDRKTENETYFNLSYHVECIRVSCIGEIDADERVDDVIRVAGNAVETVPEVCMRILDVRSTSENDKTSDRNEYQNNQLDG